MHYHEKWSLKILICIFTVAAAAIAPAWLIRPEAEGVAAAGHPGSLIRFHIIANSDSPEDQALKLEVRDAVVQAVAPALEGAGDIRQARERVDESLDLIKATATRVLRENGCDQTVGVMRGNYDFPGRTYQVNYGDGKAADLNLPAGRYEAVRVVIGGGGGSNWWCVLFPPLCFVNPSQDPGHSAAKGDLAGIPAFGHGPEGPEGNGRAGAVPPVEYRLKVLEWYRQIRDWGVNSH